MAGYNTLDTKAFNDFISQEATLVKTYNDLVARFGKTVTSLLSKWEGAGADAFKGDADTVRSNIAGLGDILKTMCDMLFDCREIFNECDKSLGAANRDAANG